MVTEGPQKKVRSVQVSDTTEVEKRYKARHKKIDLMKINIEGSEYELLEHLIESGCIKKITDIQVQFHNFVPNAPEKRSELHKKLSRTHYMTYNYPWIWENWRLKK